MSRLLAVVLTVLTVLALGSSPAPAAPEDDPIEVSPTYPTWGMSPDGANDWTCRPTAERPTPVIIVHGTFGDQKSLLDELSRAMADQGFCVYALDYGNRGTRPIEESAGQLDTFVDEVLAATGAARVQLVGHSQGGMMPRYYIKFLGGDQVVDDLVGLAPSNHGTRASGPHDNPITGSEAQVVFCQACIQQEEGSEFLTNLNAGDETPGPVSYTQITTEYDTVVVPHTSGYLAPGELTTNLTLQDVCPNDTAEHLQIPMSDTAIALTLNALTRDGAADPAYQPAC
jgi:triacylglycerol esterase/lipase EstA (alpha/beta hydrolase family)